MDAINNMASAAAKVVWGESNTTKENENPAMAAETTTAVNKDAYAQEPVSGKQGDVSKGEPFDAGNIGTHLSGFLFFSLIWRRRRIIMLTWTNTKFCDHRAYCGDRQRHHHYSPRNNH